MSPLIGAAFVALLCLLAMWQGRVERQRRAKAVEQIEEARALGADRALSQHPQIQPLLCIGCGSCIRACPESGVLELIGGIAHVVQGSKCIGHGLCEVACPVGALTVSLGDVSQRPDIPLLSDELETDLPGIFIAGELGGIALIRHAILQGSQVVETIAARPGRAGRELEDVLIVGAGPAGLAASLKAVEHGLSYVTIDQASLGGTISKYPRRKLVLTHPVALPLGERLKRREYLKEELVDHLEAMVRRHGVQIQEHVKLHGIQRRDGVFQSRTSAGVIHSRFVVLALGRRGTPRKLGVPGEELEKVLYQLVDAASYQREQLLVVGGGDSAIEAATALADQPGNTVTLSYRKPGFFRLKARNAERIERYREAGRVNVVFESRVAAIDRDQVALEGARPLTLPNDYTFVFAGGEPPFPLLRDIGVRFGGAA